MHHYVGTVIAAQRQGKKKELKTYSSVFFFVVAVDSFEQGQ